MAWPTHIVAAGGYVLHPHGHILLVKTYRRGWDCPGGQVEIGESLEAGVLREIYEESGITASVRCLVGVYSNVGQYTYPDGTHVPTKVMLDFLCDYVSGEPGSSDETSESAWVAQDDVSRYIQGDPIKLRFDQALHFDGRVRYCSYITRPSFQLLSDRYI